MTKIPKKSINNIKKLSINTENNSNKKKPKYYN